MLTNDLVFIGIQYVFDILLKVCRKLLSVKMQRGFYQKH